MGLITFIKKIFKAKKKCKHRFDAEQVRDFNTDPKCTVCGIYFTAVVSQGRYRFTIINDNEYGIEKVR